MAAKVIASTKRAVKESGRRRRIQSWPYTHKKNVSQRNCNESVKGANWTYPRMVIDPSLVADACYDGEMDSTGPNMYEARLVCVPFGRERGSHKPTSMSRCRYCLSDYDDFISFNSPFS